MKEYIVKIHVKVEEKEDAENLCEDIAKMLEDKVVHRDIQSYKVETSELDD